MKLVKKTSEYKIYQRRDERYAVEDKKGKAINGEEKAKILLAEELIKLTAPNPVEEAPVEEAAPEEAAPEAEASEEAPAAE